MYIYTCQYSLVGIFQVILLNNCEKMVIDMLIINSCMANKKTRMSVISVTE